MYYLRTRAAADAIKFTVDTGFLKVNGVCVLALGSIYFALFPTQLLKTSPLIMNTHVFCRMLMALMALMAN